MTTYAFDHVEDLGDSHVGDSRSLRGSLHGVSLTRGGLTIREDGAWSKTNTQIEVKREITCAVSKIG